MSLTADTWLTDLETDLYNHIVTYMNYKSKSVNVRIGETELPRPLKKPFIVILTGDDIQSHIGGMDIYSDTQQGEKHEISFFLQIITDDDSGGKKERGVLSSLLTTFVFGAHKPTFLTEISGIELTISFDGNGFDSTVKDNTQYLAQFRIVVTVIVPYTSVVLA